MKNIFIYLLPLFCLIISNCSHDIKTFTIKGKIIGLDSGNIILAIRTDSMLIYDTSKVIKGEFIFKGTIEEPVGVIIEAGNGLRVDMFIEPGTMNLTLNKDKFQDFKLFGSKTQEELELLFIQKKKTRVVLDSLWIEYSYNRNVIDTITNEEDRIEIMQINEEIDEQIASLNKINYEIEYEFIKTHPKSYLSPDYILVLHQQGYLSLDSAKQALNNLSHSIQESSKGQFLSKYIRTLENIQIGAIAKDFKAIDLRNQVLTLSQFRDQNVVLIEFWASWCRPCRASFPFLKDIYKKYSNKGFKIIAISKMDTNKETWISAIKQDSIENWLHLATTFQKDEPINEEILQDYPNGPIPLSILVDKEGRIVGSWRGYYPQNEKELEILLNELLNTTGV